MRHIKKYDSSTVLNAEGINGELGNPYVATYGDVIDYNSTSFTSANTDYQNYRSYFYATSDEGCIVTPGSACTNMYYSTDGANWNSFTEGVTLSSNKTYFKGTYTQGQRVFGSTSAKYSIGGNIMSLFVGDDFLTVRDLHEYPGDYLFAEDGLGESHNLVSAYDLCINVGYVGTLFMGCFKNCSNLTAAPKYIYVENIPTIGLYYMFYYCTGITSVNFYVGKSQMMGCMSMLEGCSSLNNITCLVKDKPGDSWTGFSPGSWVRNVAASGTFTKNKYADWWGTDIPSGWTVVDSE